MKNAKISWKHSASISCTEQTYMMASMKLKTVIKLGTSAALTLGFYNVYTGDPRTYENFIMPAIRMLSNGEQSHIVAVKAARYGFVPRVRDNTLEAKRIMKTNLFGIELDNPIGLAAGFDKDGEAIVGLSHLGFDFIEVGSTTPEPQKGNMSPRVFRLSEDRAIINRYGFNSLGHDEMYANLERQASEIRAKNIVVGVNLGKNKSSKDAAADYVKGLEKFYDLDVVKYFVINISSPNTPNLRKLQESKQLSDLLYKVLENKAKFDAQFGVKKPLLLKITADLSPEQLEDIAKIVNKFSKSTDKLSSVDGLIISNTTITRPMSLKSDPEIIREEGGLSGPPLKDMSLKAVGQMSKLTNLPIIAVGGVESGQDAFNVIAAGASALQLYTSMAYFGPPIVRKVIEELAILKKNMNSIYEAIGYQNK